MAEPDERTKRWAAENDWFGQDTEMTGFAFGVHETLVKSGINPQTQADEYYSRIDESMRQRFPDKFGGQEVEEAPARQTGNVVAPKSECKNHAEAAYLNPSLPRQEAWP